MRGKNKEREKKGENEGSPKQKRTLPWGQHLRTQKKTEIDFFCFIGSDFFKFLFALLSRKRPCLQSDSIRTEASSENLPRRHFVSIKMVDLLVTA
ncbi:hypothetical protein CDAR_411311 [Caerostris darwini]|uniref:Uncharacterized protein n=1 Tax=Caerostris darwini TaxID=1538125 RepID=A0AAV4SHP3_9ARAC|nr:hypothetical protein CDAR_411311 [Caerostris darwini]